MVIPLLANQDLTPMLYATWNALGRSNVLFPKKVNTTQTEIPITLMSRLKRFKVNRDICMPHICIVMLSDT